MIQLLISFFNLKKKVKVNAQSIFLQYSSDDSRPTVLVTLISVDEKTVTRALLRHGNKNSYRVVFIVTNPDVRLFQEAECIFEYLPAPTIVENMQDVGDWQSYLQERWNMINSKWSPRWTVEYGLNIKTYLNKTKYVGTLTE